MKLEMPTLRRAFVTGMLVLAPIAVTLWVFVSLFRYVDGLMRPLLARMPVLGDSMPEQGITGIGFLTAMIVVTVVGLLANNLLGRALIGGIDRGLNRIPWIKAVYNASKDIAVVLFGGKGSVFRKVVVFEYPRQGLYSIGFVTRENAEVEDGVLHVFLPTTPNPTSGYFLMVPRKDAIQLPITVENGIKLVVSGGAVLSEENLQHLGESLSALRKEST